MGKAPQRATRGGDGWRKQGPLGCSLKKEKGANAQCSKYGHRHALKVTTATSGGKELPEMKGWTLHYLDTDKAQPFIKEHHNEIVTLKGRVYTEERRLILIHINLPVALPENGKWQGRGKLQRLQYPMPYSHPGHHQDIIEIEP